MKISSIVGFVLLSLTGAQAQSSANYVTEIVTDYKGYWQSGSGTGATSDPNAIPNPILPDNSHQLLAFTLNGTRYTTGVNDQLLKDKSVVYTASRYQTLPVSTLSSAITSNTKIALGQLYDNVDNGANSPPPANDYTRYLTDGAQGLDLGTGVANLPVGTLKFPVSSVVSAAIGDGVPDMLITQIASPDASVGDKYQFLDASGATIGKQLVVLFTNVPVVGNWTADFYEASQSAMTLQASFTKTQRPLRLWAADFSAFEITTGDYSRIKSFQITLSGSSDQAFVAYNSNALSFQPLPVVLTAFEGVAQGSIVHLNWQTASERNAEAFVVETSADGQGFAPVGRVVAAGTSPQAHRYQFEHQPQPGLNYYRLHQLDFDGVGTYSSVVAVRTGAAAITVFPSEFTQGLTVRLPAAGMATLTLLAPDGRVLHQQQLAHLPAQDLALPGLASLPPGLYLLRLVLDGQASLHRVVKQ